MFWAPAYGPLRMMKHHVRLVIFIRDLRMKIVIAFLFSVDMTIWNWYAVDIVYMVSICSYVVFMPKTRQIRLCSY